jgi:hypothetical protein
MGLAQLALRIALARRLDLDHLGAIIAHHRGGDRPGDEARQVENTQSRKRQMTSHRKTSSGRRSGFHITAGIAIERPMSLLRGRLLAALVIAAFLAALIWLPLAAALAIGAVACLVGVVRFRRPAWRNSALVGMSLLMGFAGVELALGLLSPRAPNVGVVKERTPGNWLVSDPELGYRLRPDTVVKSVARHADDVLYRATYAIGPKGERITPGSVPQGPTYLFVGDSYMFGEGVADDETLAAQFARRIQPAANVVNVAVGGHGPTHILRALETGLYDQYVVGKVAAVIAWVTPVQLWRVTGDGTWLGSSPRYELDATGKPRHTGTFAGHRWRDPLDGAAYLARTHVAWIRRAVGPALEKEQAALYVALLRRIKELVQERYGAPLILLSNGPEPVPPGYSDQPDLQYLPAFDAIRGLGTPVISVRALLGPPTTWDRYFIPHDGHPTPPMNKLVAEALLKTLPRHDH